MAPFLGLASYKNVDLEARLLPPSSGHWFGTDELGRDVFCTFLYGGRISFLVSVIVVTICFSAGVLLGSVCGMDRRYDSMKSSCDSADVLLAFPGLLLAIALMAVLGPSLQNVILALIVIGWIPYATANPRTCAEISRIGFCECIQESGRHLNAYFNASHVFQT